MTSKINSSSSKITQEHTGAKPKATIPLRVLDEEVWISGSELKTDNDSSEEERGRLRKAAESKVKKGARKKTKYIHSAIPKSSRTKQQQQQQQVQKTESSAVAEELTSTSGNLEDATAPPVQWRPKREISFEEFFDIKEFQECDTFLKTLEETNLEEYRNQADDEKSQLQKINKLEERIRKAERHYMNTRMETDKYVREMFDILNCAKDFKEPEWNYFIEITKKWVNCFSKGTSTTMKLKAELSYTQSNDPENMSKKSKKRPVRKMSAKHNVFMKNTKQNSKSKSEKKTNSPHTQKENLDIVLQSIEDRSKDNLFYEPYKYTAIEMERISKIDQQLSSFKSCVSLDQFDCQINNSRAEAIEELENRNKPLTDAEKLQICNIPYSKSFDDIFNDEIEPEIDKNEEEFDSCEEFVSSRRC